MNYFVDFRLYSRPFIQPLQTYHGVWKTREGIIIRLTDTTGKIGWGEIAPLPWFGSESLSEAWLFCQGLKGLITVEQVKLIPDSLPSCQFGFESALEGIKLGHKQTQKTIKKGGVYYSYLLPTGEKVLQEWGKVLEKGGTTFKWKIGVKNIIEEMRIFEKLIEVLPQRIKLRLDANGGLNLEEAKLWLKLADESGIVEFVEQPLSPLKFDFMLKLSQEYTTPLALDESVSNLIQLEQCYQQGWRGIVIIKAAIAGFPTRLRQLVQNYSLDIVFSSVFETSIARNYILGLTEELVKGDRAMGLGVDHWFKDDEADFLSNLWKNF
ncbi:Mandelate racemase/muconate lactonizing protein [Rippkaea orientalis PCC 8801]|uniref:o-succinylbenzoate synthase n=1 Tax=Rippkaea orientalis (strain PCC 8801 / RF-1) TaxID=41431 RepID=B7K2D8_RIPO1|nr:o-succinylbenzoate synthase [Rippkaea orientalis]ACK65274.1 Mandelate racemase/muconate lactonizing protein [Rippkaea orientalis PCC 8801]